MNDSIFNAPKHRPGYDPYGRPLNDYCLADNKAISCMTKDRTMKRFVEHIGRIFGFKPTKWNTQPEIALRLDGKHIRLDLLMEDALGRTLDVETQASPERHLIDRLTAYTATMVYNQLRDGDNFETLKETVIAFICKDDPLKRGSAIETIEMVRLSDGTPVNAKFRWIVLSLKRLKNPQTELEWLLHDFFCKDISKIHSPAMAERLQYLRSEEGISMMFETREEEFARKEAILREKVTKEVTEKVTHDVTAKVRAKDKAEYVTGLLKEELPVEVIARALKISPGEVRAIAKESGIKLP